MPGFLLRVIRIQPSACVSEPAAEAEYRDLVAEALRWEPIGRTNSAFSSAFLKLHAALV